MPELPEVETIVRQLCEGGTERGPSLLGQTITAVTVRWPRHIATPAPAALRRDLPGQRVQAVRRRGKFIIVELSQGVLLIHLKMSGDLVVVPATAPPDKHAHTVFRLGNGYDLRFTDARKFGKVFYVRDANQVIGSLGPEPLEAAFTARELGRRLALRHRQLKPLLLDQTFIAGLGNIYTDEALHRAGLHPLRRSDELQPREVNALWRGIRQALQAGLRHHGASIDWVYRGGGFQRHFRVYGRAGEPCRNCGTAIRRITVGQRGTHFCPHCQAAVPGEVIK